jgi:hypothetical protein
LVLQSLPGDNFNKWGSQWEYSCGHLISNSYFYGNLWNQFYCAIFYWQSSFLATNSQKYGTLYSIFPWK